MSLLLLLWGDPNAAPPVAPSVAGSYAARKKRYFAKVGDKVLVFGSEAAAANAMLAEEKPQETVSLPAVKKFAKASGQAKQYKAALGSQHYEALLAMFEQMRDEEDVELLLMAA